MQAKGNGVTAWKRTTVLKSLLDLVPVSADAKRDLCKAMSGVGRHYHNIDHLALLWKRHERYGAAASLRSEEIDRLVASAIAYHDAIYSPDRHDNEERSADLWLKVSNNGRIADAERTWVADTIRATSDHLAYAPAIVEANPSLSIMERARIWVLDLDLTPLGEEPNVFDANTDRLRAESAKSGAAEFESGLIRFLQRFDTARSIFRSPVLSAAFETQARENIRRRLVKLDASSEDGVR